MKLPEQIEPAEVEKGMEEDMSISGAANQLQCEQDRAAPVSLSPVITAAADSTTSGEYCWDHFILERKLVINF